MRAMNVNRGPRAEHRASAATHTGVAALCCACAALGLGGARVPVAPSSQETGAAPAEAPETSLDRYVAGQRGSISAKAIARMKLRLPAAPGVDAGVEAALREYRIALDQVVVRARGLECARTLAALDSQAAGDDWSALIFVKHAGGEAAELAYFQLCASIAEWRQAADRALLQQLASIETPDPSGAEQLHRAIRELEWVESARDELMGHGGYSGLGTPLAPELPSFLLESARRLTPALETAVAEAVIAARAQDVPDEPGAVQAIARELLDWRSKVEDDVIRAARSRNEAAMLAMRARAREQGAGDRQARARAAWAQAQGRIFARSIESGLRLQEILATADPTNDLSAWTFCLWSTMLEGVVGESALAMTDHTGCTGHECPAPSRADQAWFAAVREYQGPQLKFARKLAAVAARGGIDAYTPGSDAMSESSELGAARAALRALDTELAVRTKKERNP